ncbi:MAG: hypothetical protein GY901_02180 [Actinomycetia bacterium]|nr:hypothetical protein [Actinomycetes bacterium]
MHRTPRNSRAFTVLELVAVVVITGVLAGLGSVTYDRLIADAGDEVTVARATAAVREAFAGEMLVDADLSDVDAGDTTNGVAKVIAAGEAQEALVTLAIQEGSSAPTDGSELAHYVVSAADAGVGTTGYMVVPGSTVTEDHVIGYNSTVVHPDPIQPGCIATFTKWAGVGTRLWAVPTGTDPVAHIAANLTTPFVNMLWQGGYMDHDGNTAAGPGNQWGTTNVRFDNGMGFYTQSALTVSNGAPLVWKWATGDDRVYLRGLYSSWWRGQSQTPVPAGTELYMAFSAKNDSHHRYSNPATVSC